MTGVKDLKNLKILVQISVLSIIVLLLLCRSLPRETRRDAIDVQSEDQFVDFMRQRDTPSGNLCFD